MNTIERYEILIRAALEVRQLRFGIKQNLNLISANITVAEIKSNEFNTDIARKALGILKDERCIEFERAPYVGSRLLYKDIQIALHLPTDTKLNNYVMSKILEGIVYGEL